MKLRLLDVFFLLVLFGLTVAFYNIIAPFLLVIFLAIVAANITGGMFTTIARKMPKLRPLAAGITVITSALVILVPVTIIGIVVAGQALRGYESLMAVWPDLSSEINDIELFQGLRELPFLGQYMAQFETLTLNELLLEAFNITSSFILELSQRSFASISSALINFVFMLFVMFFVLLDGRKLLRVIRELTPMSDHELNELIRETFHTTNATIISTLIIGILEGTFGAVLFTIFGLPTPALWGVIMMIVSMIPLVGTNIVLTPAGIIMILGGQVLPGILLIVLGFAGVAISQNVIKPKLLGNRTGLHPVLVLLSTIGGILWLGLIGFLVGPLIASLFIVAWRQFGKRFQTVLKDKNE